MEAKQNFRSAFNGFNREDVVRYIEFLNSKHAAEITQLRSEIQFLSTKEEKPAVVETVQEDTAPLTERIAQQEAQISEVSGRCGALEEEVSALKAEKEQLVAEKAELEEQLAALRQENEAHKARIADELEAYRRAERMERLANERAEQLCQQVNGVLADTTVKVENASNLVSDLSDRVMGQLMELQTAVTGTKQILRDATATLYTIRPTAENE